MSYGMGGSSFTSKRDNTGSGARGGSTGDIIPKGYRKGQLQQFNPNQMKLFEQLFSHVSPDSYLSKLSSGDQSTFEQMEAPEHRNFQGQLGQLASRFSGMGLGGRKSSGFRNSATAASSNFAQDLASKRHDLQRQAIMDLMGISQSLLGQKPTENLITPKSSKKSFMDELLASLSGGVGSGLGEFAQSGLQFGSKKLFGS